MHSEWTDPDVETSGLFSCELAANVYKAVIYTLPAYPSRIIAPDTPKDMITANEDRIPPREPTKYTVELTGPQLAEGDPAVTVVVGRTLGQQGPAKSGSVELETAAPNPEWANLMSLSLKSLKYANGMYVYTGQVRGSINTAPDNAKPGENAAQIHLVVASQPPVAKKENQMAVSNGFSVAALPLNIDEAIDSKRTENLNSDTQLGDQNFRGVVLVVGVDPKTGSDSGNVNDLSGVFITERLENASPPTGLFVGLPLRAAGYPPTSAAMMFSDTLALNLSLLILPKDGTRTIYQVHIFKDAVTGARDIVVPKSGYVVSVQVISTPPIRTLSIEVEGKAVTVTDSTTDPDDDPNFWSWSSAAGATEPAGGIIYIDRIVPEL